jgi:hypothetical protein
MGHVTGRVYEAWREYQSFLDASLKRPENADAMHESLCLELQNAIDKLRRMRLEAGSGEGF